MKVALFLLTILSLSLFVSAEVYDIREAAEKVM